MVRKCEKDFSIDCPFPSCIGSSIEFCNLRSGRFSRKLLVGYRVNFAVLNGSNFVKLRRVSSF
jgi:hypothetical protein